MIGKQSWAVVAAVALWMGVGAAAADNWSPGAVAARLDPILSAAHADGPGCATLVSHKGQVIYRHNRGLANLEYGVPITSATIFDVGSTSKQFVAASAAMLALMGKLDLNADIRGILTDLPDYGKTVTVRHLINHASGIGDVYKILEVQFGDPDGNLYPSELTLQYLRRMKDLAFEPGTEYAYSNSGYLLLAEIVEKVSGKTLRQFTDEMIFKPLGMTHSHFHDDFREIVMNRAHGYGAKADGWEIRNSNFYVVGDGGLYSTVEDIAKWYHNFADNKLYGGKKLIQMLTTPESYSVKGPSYLGASAGYSFGNLHLNRNGYELFGHPGGWAGFGSVPFLNRATDTALIMLCNVKDRSNMDRYFQAADAVFAPNSQK